MKKISSALSRYVSRLCAVCLAILGFSCSSSEDEDEPPCMYGTPLGTFEIKGTVSTENGEEVSNATIRVAEPERKSEEFSISTTATGNKGGYVTKEKTFPYEKVKVVCLPDDKSLVADSVIIDLKYSRNSDNDNSWNVGHAKSTVDFTLRKKDKK